MGNIISDLRDRVLKVRDGLQSGSIIRDVVVTHEMDIYALQQRQLFAGKASSGDDLRPYYSEDLKPGGHFWSVETAKNYAAWKSSLSYPYDADRNPDAPNLYINGKFHSELGVEFGPDAVGIVGTTPYAKGIMAKYGVNSFGLSSSSWGVLFAELGGLSELMTNISELLW